jgi:predicted Zn-dependent protease with MMP-like domain
VCGSRAHFKRSVATLEARSGGKAFTATFLPFSCTSNRSWTIIEHIAAQPSYAHESMSKPHHYSEREFEQLVSSALDELPSEFQRALEHVAVVVSDRGAENHAYGMYVGSRLGGSPFFGGGGMPDEIMIFRDTLVRDFGDYPGRLKAHVIETVRHEVAHHLGFDEAGVRKLGL